MVGGRTAHSAFNIPLNVDKQDFPMCGIKKQSDLAKRLRKCQVIFWDECTMTHKKALEAVNASLQDIRNEVSTTMGGVLLVLAGDFRQTLPIISKGTAADQINACIKRSTLWDAVETMSLTINMRVNLGNDTSAGQFAEQLLKIGNGLYPMDADCKIKIDTSIATLTSSVEELIKNIFPELESNYAKENWITDRAILAPLNRNVDELNIICQSKIPGKSEIFDEIVVITLVFLLQEK